MTQPILGNVELQQVQVLDCEEHLATTQHAVPALEGDFLQRHGRELIRLALQGVLIGPEARQGLETLREQFRTARPLPFVADVTTATCVGEVLIETLDVRELAGRPERFAYSLALREFIEPPQPAEVPAATVEVAVAEEGEQQAAQQLEAVTRRRGSLEVRVTLGGDRQDFTGIVVLVEGAQTPEGRVTLLLEEQVGGVYARDDVPSGRYEVVVFRR